MAATQTFRAESMVDMTHANRLGASVFSEMIAEAFKTAAGGGARSGRALGALPEYRTPPTDVAIEDLNQSLECLGRRIGSG